MALLSLLTFSGQLWAQVDPTPPPEPVREEAAAEAPAPDDAVEVIVPVDPLDESEPEEQPEPEPEVTEIEPAVPDDEPGSCDRSVLVPEIYWRKAMEWIDSDHESEGELLLQDLHREYPNSDHGLRAGEWLDKHVGLDHSGRTQFVIGSSVMGSYFGFSLAIGLAVDNLDGSDAVETAIWSAFGGAAVGLVSSLLASSSMTISESQGMLYNFLGGWGWYNGFMVYDLIYPIEVDGAFLSGAIGMGTALATSFLLWDELNVQPGTAAFAVFAGSYSFLLIGLANVVVGGETVFRDNEAAALLSLLIPTNAALVGGFFLGDHLDWTRDDIGLISLGGFMGSLLGLALSVTIDDLHSSVRAAAGTMLGCTVVGLAGALLMVAPWEKSGGAAGGPPNNALLNIGANGLQPGIPVLSVAPTYYRGEVGYAVEFPLLNVSM